MMILDSTFPLHITLADLPASSLPSYCPGLKAFQDAIKWSLAQGSKVRNSNIEGSAIGDHPLMDSGQVSTSVAYTSGFVGTRVQEIKMPLGEWKGGKRHSVEPSCMVMPTEADRVDLALDRHP